MLNKSFWNNRLRRLVRDENASVNEWLGLLFFVLLIITLLVPLGLEALLYANQINEIDRITGYAAKKACTLRPNLDVPEATACPFDDGITPLSEECLSKSFPLAFDVGSLRDVAFNVFKNDPANTGDYPDADFQFRLLDANGAPIDLPGGNKIVGSNAQISLCPSGSQGGGDWSYCVQGSDADIKSNLSQTNINRANEDLIARMSKFAPGTCMTSDSDCNAQRERDFAQRVDRCSVCATKLRNSIFTNTLLGPILGCDPDSRPLFSCQLKRCGSSRLTSNSTLERVVDLQRPEKLGPYYIGSGADPDANQVKRIEEIPDYDRDSGQYKASLDVLFDTTNEKVFKPIE